MQETSPKFFAFVLMPFSREFEDIYDLGIKSACMATGCYCERVDEQIFSEGILDRIYNQISKADLIIADMTGQNANVFYETGYAHALNKKVILLTQNANDIPFDLKHYPHIVYGKSIKTLASEVKKRVEYFAKNQNAPAMDTSSFLVPYADDMRLEDGEVIPVSNTISTGDRLSGTRNNYYIHVHFHSSPDRTIETQRLRYALLCERNIRFGILGPRSSSIQDSSVDIPDNKRVIEIPLPHRLLPNEWCSIKVIIRAYERPASPGTGIRFPVTLRVMSEITFRDIDFQLEIKRSEHDF